MDLNPERLIKAANEIGLTPPVEAPRNRLESEAGICTPPLISQSSLARAQCQPH